MKTRKKNVKTKPVELKPKAEKAQLEPAAPTVVTDDGPPPPEALFEMAQMEEERQVVEEYFATIRLLRDEKRFTFREIAQWLSENGVETDHNAVYRVYLRNFVPPEQRE